jgi:hypothetical protein
MLVTIAINSYNYERYLREAIDSALAQTWQPLEVVVVDDGSTDGSWPIIESYGPRIRALRQANAGQGAAYNAGFAAARGRWILFLDSDDRLDADAVARMMQLAQADVAKVQGALRRVDAQGHPLGGMVPYLVHDGDVRPIARRFGEYASPPASGNLYRREAIERWFPLPAAPWRRGADTVPILLSAFCGRVATVSGAAGDYRLHTQPNQRSGVLGNEQRSLAEALQQAEAQRRRAMQWGTERAGIVWSHELLTLPWDWRTRVLSWRLDRDRHPHAGDSRLALWRGACASLAPWPGYTWRERLLQRVWVAFMLLAPRSWVLALAGTNAGGGLRSRLVRQRRVPT